MTPYIFFSPEKKLWDPARPSHVIKALRKYFGVPQSELAQQMNLGQGTLSKIENGLLEISAIDWFTLCQHFNIDPHFSFKTGIIDFGKPLILSSERKVGLYRIPKKYCHNKGISIRQLRPLLMAMETFLEKKLWELMDELGLDPDFFVINDNTLNHHFVIDLLHHFFKNANITDEELWMVIDQNLSDMAYQHQSHETKEVNPAMNLGVIEFKNYTLDWTFTNQTYNKDRLQFIMRPAKHLMTASFFQQSAFFQTYLSYQLYFFGNILSSVLRQKLRPSAIDLHAIDLQQVPVEYFFL